MRFAILGNSGSGKSTLAAALADRYAIPALDLDTVAWEPAKIGVARSLNDSAQDVSSFCSRNNSFLVEGGYEDLIAASFPFNPVLVFLDLGVEVCESHCRARPFEPHKYQSPEAQNEKLQFLLQWVRDYYTRSGPMSYMEHVKLFEAYRGPKARHRVPVVIGTNGEIQERA